MEKGYGSGLPPYSTNSESSGSYPGASMPTAPPRYQVDDPNQFQGGGLPPPGFSPGAPPLPASNLVEKVEISIEGDDLWDMGVVGHSNPACVLFSVIPGGEEVEEGRTETIMDTNKPKWTKKIEMNYRFEERQVLRFVVYHWNKENGNDIILHEKLGLYETSLGEIMMKRGRPLTLNLTGGDHCLKEEGTGKLIICGETVAKSRERVTLKFAASGLDNMKTFGKSNPFLIISRCTDAQDYYTAVHRTEHILDTLDPVWNDITIPLHTLSGGDDNRALKIECCHWVKYGEHKLIGECHASMKQLREASTSARQFALINPKKKAKKFFYKDSGMLILNSCAMFDEFSFLDYIKGGTQLHFSVAVDFTASNGDPRLENSLHYWNPAAENQYETVIKAVGEIIQEYDSNKQFPALGFGGRVPPSYEVSHEFFLNGRADTPYCQGIDGVLSAYRHSLSTVGLFGPTNFAPVIKHTSQFARTYQQGMNYFVLLIITDGDISDLAETKKSLIECAQLPMSVIIIGVGTEDFSTMEQLDGKRRALSHQGVKAVRDVVQFVAYSKHMQWMKNEPHRAKQYLAKEVLLELPQQFTSWMKYKGIAPLTVCDETVQDSRVDPYHAVS